MNTELLFALLRNTVRGPVKIDVLSNEAHLTPNIVRQNVLDLAKNSLLKNIGGGNIEVSEGQRMNLIIYALREGADLERICRALGWGEFEDLAALVLEQNGYRTKKHFRFKGPTRRYEIDVVGIKEPRILSVECKRWKRSWRTAATVDVVRMQVERTRALEKYLPEPKDRLKVAEWKEVKLMPVVITLSDTPLKIFNGVPVIPIFHFNSFLNEMQAYSDELTFFESMKHKSLDLK